MMVLHAVPPVPVRIATTYPPIAVSTTTSAIKTTPADRMLGMVRKFHNAPGKRPHLAFILTCPRKLLTLGENSIITGRQS